MKHSLWIAPAALIIALLASIPLHAQDDGGGGGGFGGGGFDLGGFGGGGGGGGGNRGGGQQQQQATPRVRDLLTQANPAESLMTLLKSALEKDKAPKLSKDQEKEITAFFTKEVKASAASIEAKAKELGLNPPAAQVAAPPIGRSGQEIVQLYLELGSGRGNTGNNNQNRGNGGNRGGNNNNNNNNANNNRLNLQVLRPAEEAFLIKLANAPALNLKQKTAVLNWKNDVLKQRGGIDEFRIQIEEAGAPPLTPEQMTQLQTAFDESDQKRTTLRNDLNQRIRDLLNPGEAPAANSQPANQNQTQNNNPNAINQLQNLGRIEEAKLAALSAEMRKKTDALDLETNTKILRALQDPQRQAFVKIEGLRQQQRQQQLLQQRQQLLTPRG